MISIKSPTRVDLSGGTLDLWPLYMFLGQAKTINLAIDIYTYVDLEIRKTPEIEIESADLGIRKFYAHISHLLTDHDPNMALFRAHLEYWKPEFGFKLVTRSESPVGGGLGGSSSLTISLLKAFSKAMLQPFKDVHQLVSVAHNLEARMLLTPTGKQDYYPAASGGLNILTFDADGVKQKVLPITLPQMQDRFLLAYTGKAHHSGLNNFEVLTHTVQKNPQVVKALVSIKTVAEQMSVALERGQWEELPALFEKEFEARVQLAKSFSSAEIDKLREVSMQAGAQAVKICGAGGGGCVLVWCALGKKAEIASAIEAAGFKVLPALPVAPLESESH